MALNSYSLIWGHSTMAHLGNIPRASWWNCWEGCQRSCCGLGGTCLLNRPNCQT